MPFESTHIGLKAELSKLAKTSNIQAGLPFILRGLPVAAILAGEAIAKVSGGPNRVEERLLGFDETVLLNLPSHNPVAAVSGNNRDHTRPGVVMMCARCWRRSKDPATMAQLQRSGQIQPRQYIYDEHISFSQGNRWKSIGLWRYQGSGRNVKRK